MKRFSWMLVAAVLAAGMGASSCAMSPPREKVALDGRLNCPYVPGRGGKVYLQLTIVSPKVRMHERKPVNLCVVLDRSGSMGDDRKIGNAKAALDALIDQLNEGDIFSLVIYDDVVDVLRPACRVEDRHRLHHLVEGIQPRGWTNLGGGMMEGFAQVQRYAGRKYVNRVVLLSDGLANRGITDPYELGRIARRYRDCSISLTTMGVGLDYNENLMTRLADQGGGNYYFIESSRNLASILRKEFDMIGTIVAQNAVIDLRLGRGVRLMDVIGAEYTNADGRTRINVGDLYSGERRELTVELDVPEGSGSMMIAQGDLRCDPVGDLALYGGSFSARARYSKDLAEVNRNRDMEIQAKADVAASTRRVEKALEALDEGKGELAAKELYDARKDLLNSPAAAVSGVGAMIRAQEEKLNVYQQTVTDSSGNVRRAKKAIQYDNYSVQRNK
ncbi:MAG: VWA domain-containing protein [Bacteroidota bacterium]